MNKLLYYIILTFSILKLNSQNFINPSLDGNPGTSAAVPSNWLLVKNSTFNVYALGNGSSPDIMPGIWGVNIPPSDGNAYVGMICRSNGTWESMGHELTDTLKANECYSFTIDLNWKNSNYAGYNNGQAKLRIWGIDNLWNVNTAIDYSTMELLWEAGNASVPNQWNTINVSLNPSKDFKYLIFDAHWFGSPYGGNVLIDNISPITKSSINLELGNDTILCQGQMLSLDAFNQGSQYLWNDGSTNSSINVSTSGNYAVTVSKGACSISDNINVNISTLQINLGADATLCKGDFILLDAFNQGAKYLWSDGSSNSTLNVTSNGNYSVTVTEGPCSVSDDININVIDLTTDIGDDLTLCFGETHTISLNTYADSIIWNNGIKNSTITIDEAGSYKVIVYKDQCKFEDEIQINFYDSIEIELQNTFETCPGENITIEAGSNFLSYIWNNNSTEQELTTDKNGTYFVTVTDLNNCTNTDSSEVVYKGCKDEELFIPNAFSPNGDLVNDEFIIEEKEFEKYHMMIFNRWGEKVFETYSPGDNWNGKFKEVNCPSGVYVYILDTKSNIGIEKVFKGDITLLR